MDPPAAVNRTHLPVFRDKVCSGIETHQGFSSFEILKKPQKEVTKKVLTCSAGFTILFQEMRVRTESLPKE
jgi:hypothetical protein